MRRSKGDGRAELVDAFDEFQAVVRRLAIAATQQILARELERRSSTPAAKEQVTRARRTAVTATPIPRPRPRTRTPSTTVTAAPAPTRAAPSPPAGELAAEHDHPAPQMIVAEPPSIAAHESPPVPAPEAPKPPPRRHGRVSWTRNGIIHELASWMSKHTTIDARFLRRYGPKGLVAATRREFGRFEAAMNIVNLHIAEQSSSGTPGR